MSAPLDPDDTSELLRCALAELRRTRDELRTTREAHAKDQELARGTMIRLDTLAAQIAIVEKITNAARQLQGDAVALVARVQSVGDVLDDRCPDKARGLRIEADRVVLAAGLVKELVGP